MKLIKAVTCENIILLEAKEIASMAVRGDAFFLEAIHFGDLLLKYPILFQFTYASSP